MMDHDFDLSPSEMHHEPRELCANPKCREPLPVDDEQLCSYCYSTEAYCRDCIVVVGGLQVCDSHRQRADDDLHQRCRCGKENCWRACGFCERYICAEHSVPCDGWRACTWCMSDRRLHRESVARIEARLV